MAKKEAAKTVETKTVNTGFIDNVEALEDARGTENLRYIYTGAG